jgi:hypothetical protein
MTSPITTEIREPQFRVRLYTKHLGRMDETQTGQAQANFVALQASVLGITVDRRLGQPAGVFSLTLLPKRLPAPWNTRSWDDVIAAMDFIEILIGVPPRNLRLVMRGFVDTVNRARDLSSGKPRHVIHVAGRDYGKLLLVTKLYFFDSLNPRFSLFERFEAAASALFGWSGNPTPPVTQTPKQNASRFTPEQVMGLLFHGANPTPPTTPPAAPPPTGSLTEGFYRPGEREILAAMAVLNNAGIPPMTLNSDAASQDPWEQNLGTWNPVLFQQGFAPLTDLWSLLRVYQHAPWRELYVRDTWTGPELVYRPAPWLDFDGNPVQDVPNDPTLSGTLETWDMDEHDIVSTSLSRSESDVRNFFFCYPNGFQQFAQHVQRAPALTEGFTDSPFQGNPYLVGVPGATDLAPLNDAYSFSDWRLYGFRPFEVPTPYFDWDTGILLKELYPMLRAISAQGAEGARRLAQAFGHGDTLESGHVSLKGDERVEIGHYVRLWDPVVLGARYYIEGCRQTFHRGTTQDGSPTEGRFLTDLLVTRGRGWLVRNGRAVG